MLTKSYSETMALETITPDKIHCRTVGMLWMVGFQLIFGLGLTLVGNDPSGAEAVVGIILISLHVLLAIGLLVNSTVLAHHYKNTIARLGSWTIVVTSVSGLLTVFTKNDFFSFLMGLGFLTSAGLYVRLL